jgi:hypothetical protein
MTNARELHVPQFRIKILSILSKTKNSWSKLDFSNLIVTCMLLHDEHILTSFKVFKCRNTK